MKRLLRILILLYPASWRERYGAEFAVLLAELPCQWTCAADIFLGAIKMRLNLPSRKHSFVYPLAALALAWASSRSGVCSAAVDIAERILPLLGTPVIREADFLLLPAHQISGVSLCQGAFGLGTLFLLTMSHWCFSKRHFTWQILSLGALMTSALLGYSTRIVVSGLLVEAHQPGSLVNLLGPASFLAGAAIPFSALVCAGSLAANRRPPHGPNEVY